MEVTFFINEEKCDSNNLVNLQLRRTKCLLYDLSSKRLWDEVYLSARLEVFLVVTVRNSG